MYIDIAGYETFNLHVRSYAESNYDYVMVSQLDATITNSTSYDDSKVKAHTRDAQSSGTDISHYKLVEFTGIDKGQHRITIVYRKDISSHSGEDRGYILIPKHQLIGYVSSSPKEAVVDISQTSASYFFLGGGNGDEKKSPKINIFGLF